MQCGWSGGRLPLGKGVPWPWAGPPALPLLQAALGAACSGLCCWGELPGIFPGRCRRESSRRGSPCKQKTCRNPFLGGLCCLLGGCCVHSLIGAGLRAEQGHPTLAKEGQAFLCFLAGLEPAPAWPLCPAVGFLQHPSVNGYIDTYIYMQTDLLPSPGLVFVHGNRNCCKIRVSGEGACWVCENPLTDRCCMHLHGLLLWQQEQVQSQLYGMQICLAAPRANPCSHTGG